MSETRVKKLAVSLAGLLITLSLVMLPAGLSLAQNQTPPSQQSGTTPASSSSATTTPTGGVGTILREVGGQTKLPSYDAGHASQNYQPGASQLTSIVYFVLDFFKYIFGGIAVLMLTVSGIKLIISGRAVADVMSREKENLRFSLSGLIIILVADQIVRNVFFGQEGEVYRTGTDMQMAAEQGADLARGITGIIRVFIPSVAILYFVVAGVRLLLSMGNNEKLTKTKKQLAWAILGLAVAGLSEIVVFRIIFPDQGMRLPDTQEFSRLVVQITNFVSGFVSTIAVSMLIYAGYLYVTSVGGAGLDKAKKVLTGAIIGLLIAMAAFGLVNTFIKLEPLTSVQQVQEDVPIPGT